MWGAMLLRSSVCSGTWGWWSSRCTACTTPAGRAGFRGRGCALGDGPSGGGAAQGSAGGWGSARESLWEDPEATRDWGVWVREGFLGSGAVGQPWSGCVGTA